MKKIITLLSFVLLISCIEEDEPYTYYNHIRFTNTSNSALYITFISLGTSEASSFTTRLNIGESTMYYTHYSSKDDFNGFAAAGDKIIIEFLNSNKGYICGNYPDDSGYCFVTKGSPIRSPNESDFILDKKKRDNIKYYTFEITAADYENAHVLPAVEL